MYENRKVVSTCDPGCGQAPVGGPSAVLYHQGWLVGEVCVCVVMGDIKKQAAINRKRKKSPFTSTWPPVKSHGTVCSRRRRLAHVRAAKGRRHAR